MTSGTSSEEEKDESLDSQLSSDQETQEVVEAKVVAQIEHLLAAGVASQRQDQALYTVDPALVVQVLGMHVLHERTDLQTVQRT